MSDIHKLTIYTKSLELVTQVYRLINDHKSLKYDYSLNDQIKRASISVACNISEGYYRGKKMSKNYLSIASGSANEVITLLEIIALVHELQIKDLSEAYLYLGKQINAFSSRF